MKNNVFEKVLKYIQMTGLLLRNKWELFPYFYMHSNVGHRRKRKSVLGKKLVFLQLLQDTVLVKIWNNTYQYTKAYLEIIKLNRILFCIHVSSSIYVARRE